MHGLVLCFLFLNHPIIQDPSVIGLYWGGGGGETPRIAAGSCMLDIVYPQSVTFRCCVLHINFSEGKQKLLQGFGAGAGRKEVTWET
jgi:hypothetical protein